MLWTVSARAQEPTAAELTWDQEAASTAALELDAVLATGLDLTVAGPSDANAARAVAHAEHLVVEVQELAARLAAGENREETRELMNRIGNRLALLTGMRSDAPTLLASEDAAAANQLWSELSAHYRARRAAATLETTE